MTADERDEAPGIAACWLLPGKSAGDGCVGVSVTGLVVCLEQVDSLSVFERTRLREDQAPVINRPRVLARRDASGRAFDRGFALHGLRQGAAATEDRRWLDGQRGFEATSRALVVTAKRAALGRIRQLAQGIQEPSTRLQQELDTLGRRLAIGAARLRGGVFALGAQRGRPLLPLLPLLRTAVSLGVAAIPEGLPTVDTRLLASGARSLAKRQIYARRLDAIKNLSAVDTVCFATALLGFAAGVAVTRDPDAAVAGVDEADFQRATAEAATKPPRTAAARPKEIAGTAPVKEPAGKRSPSTRKPRVQKSSVPTWRATPA